MQVNLLLVSIAPVMCMYACLCVRVCVRVRLLVCVCVRMQDSFTEIDGSRRHLSRSTRPEPGPPLGDRF